MDMVSIGEDGQVVEMVLKPRETRLRYAWICAVWTPLFTHFMHEYLINGQGVVSDNPNTEKKHHDEELSMAAVIYAAIKKGLVVNSVLFKRATYLDIGTPDNLVKAVYDTNYQSELSPLG